MTEQPLCIESAACWTAGFTFGMSVAHGLAERTNSQSVICCLTASDGTVGYGESVPRKYVTGELLHSAVDACSALAQSVVSLAIDSSEELKTLRERLADTAIENGDTAAFCALDIALLDLAGHYWNMDAAALDGLPPMRDALTYSLVVPFLDDDILDIFLDRALKAGFSAVKVKVDGDDPVARVRDVRRVLGDDIEIRVDANCSWDPADASSFIRDFADFGVVSVEQPFPRGQFEACRELRQIAPVAVTLDESVVTVADVHRVADADACDIVNVRISKCGGYTGVKRVIKAAMERGLGIQLGAQVGESCILTAAGGKLARAVPSFRWLEGAFGIHLLAEDLCEEDVRFGAGGVFRPPDGPGLGITVDPDKLDRARSRAGSAVDI